MTTRICAVFLLLALISPIAQAAGFDDRYKVFYGDFNSDGYVDLHVKRVPAAVVIPMDDIPIVIGAQIKEFVLLNDHAGSFTLSGITPAQAASIQTWPEATGIGTKIRDIDLNGRDDLDLTGIASAVPGALDQIIFADAASGSLPLHATAVNTKFRRFHTDLLSWIADHTYFDRYAPPMVSGTEPGSKIWAASVVTSHDPNSFWALQAAIAHCYDLYGQQRTCGVSLIPPTQCNQPGLLYDAAGNIVGTGTRDVCSDEWHVYSYPTGTVVLVANYSYFDADAKRAAEILKHFQDGCPNIDQQLTDEFTSIVNAVWGFLMVGPYSPNRDNNVQHPQFPGDTLFNTIDPTFHHYDVVTKVCNIGRANCDVPTLTGQVLRLFSYTSFQLQPQITSVNGAQHVLVFVTSPGLTDDPAWYVIPFGTVTQNFVQAPIGAGAIQNVTDSNHPVYPGTITRLIIDQTQPFIADKTPALYVFTHGIGINRAFCQNALAFRAIDMYMALTNDIFGAGAFATNDKQMVKYFNAHY